MEFEEKHGLKIWWLYLITGITIFPTVVILLFYKGGLGYETLKEMYFLPLLTTLSPFLIIFLIQQNQLTLKINSEGISYRYFPFNYKLKAQTWGNIDRAYIRDYNAFSEYGGYGIKNRLWFKFKDKAYLLNDGHRGLQLEFKNGKKLLFSTNKVEELESFLINIKTRYNIQAINRDGGER